MYFEAFGSVEEAFARLREQEAEANKRTSPEQAAITYGDHFVRLWDTWGSGVLTIYGYIPTKEQISADEKSLGASDGELAARLTQLDASYAHGRRYSWCYSVAEPDGEPGFTHVSTMTKISGEEFETAKARGWM